MLLISDKLSPVKLFTLFILVYDRYDIRWNVSPKLDIISVPKCLTCTFQHAKCTPHRRFCSLPTFSLLWKNILTPELDLEFSWVQNLASLIKIFESTILKTPIYKLQYIYLFNLAFRRQHSLQKSQQFLTKIVRIFKSIA